MSVIGQRLDHLTVGPRHLSILRLIGAGMVLNGVDLSLAGVVLAALVVAKISNVALNAEFISVTFIGLLIGALLAGFLGDAYGRRFSYQANLLIFGLGSLAGALAPNMTWLIIFRGIMGVGIGAEIVSGYAFFSEFVPAASRGKWQGIMAVLENVTQLIAPLLGLLIIPTIGWRWMFVVVGIPALIVWWLRRSLPESPRWLEAKGRTAEAQEIVDMLETASPRGSRVIAADGSRPVVGNSEGRVSFWTLFQRPLLRSTIIGMVAMAIVNLVLWGTITWVPTIFVNHGFTITKSILYTIAMGAGAPVGAYLAGILCDSLGRKWTVFVFSVTSAALGYIFGAQTDPSMIVIMGFLTGTSVFIIVSTVLGIYIPELFHTEVRLRGSGITNGFGRFANIFGPFLIAAVYTQFGEQGVFMTLGILYIILAVVVLAFGPETKQKSLEAISSVELVGGKPAAL